MGDPFLQHYRTLGIKPGCSPDQLKDAYRKLVRKWHPDHYTNQREAGTRATAERRMREINQAFRSLLDYHRRNGHLPATEDAEFESEKPAVPPFRQSSGHFEAENENDWSRPTQRSARIRPIYFILFGAALGLVWVAWNAYQPQDSARDGEAPTEASAPAAGTSDGAAPTIAMPATPQNDAYFTAGSALGKVYAVQGVPSQTRGDVWFYGKSKVFFVDGVVSRWEEDSDNPLKTKPLTEASPPTLETFGVGSTKAEVKAIQGNPLSENDTRWDYGLSQVFFQDGRVTGWHEYPLNPLKTRK
jgi:hypothetical protein